MISMSEIDGKTSFDVVLNENVMVNLMVAGVNQIAPMKFETSFTLLEMITMRPDMPSIANIKTAAYEPENNLFHVKDASGKVVGLNSHEGHYLLEWFHRKKTAIYQAGREKIAASVGGTL